MKKGEEQRKGKEKGKEKEKERRRGQREQQIWPLNPYLVLWKKKKGNRKKLKTKQANKQKQINK